MQYPIRKEIIRHAKIFVFFLASVCPTRYQYGSSIYMCWAGDVYL